LVLYFPGFDMAAKERFNLLGAAREFGFDLAMIAFMHQSYRLLGGLGRKGF